MALAQNWAKAICTSCPVRTECLAHALEHRTEHGIWGGMTERERRALLQRRPRSPPGIACSKPPGRNTSNSPAPTRNWPGAPPELLPDVVGDPAGLSGPEERGGPSC
ncbi:hypothetical protein GCM10010270_74430 [Streptomyces violaceus]|nr:hypothetical protein GCM10010270_74430 [Streptomyces janthinus]